MKKPSLINKNLILAAALISACEYSFAQTQTQTYNTSGTFTFTVPAGVSSIIVECWGAGGGGGGNSTTADGAGGGGGGAYSRSVLTVTPGNFSLTVGAGGAGGSGGNGTDGGDTWFGSSTTILAAGGKRGYAPSGGAAGVSGAGGLASASVGDVRYNGGNGGTGRNNNTVLEMSDTMEEMEEQEETITQDREGPGDLLREREQTAHPDRLLGQQLLPTRHPKAEEQAEMEELLGITALRDLSPAAAAEDQVINLITVQAAESEVREPAVKL